MKQRIIKGLVCLAVPGVILFSPCPEGLSLIAWKLFAFYLGAIAGLILRPFSEPVMLLANIAGVAVICGQLGPALAGYSNSVSWLVFVAFLIGQAFVDTGLGRRIAFVLLRALGKTPLQLGYATSVTDGILALAVPSNTARSGGLTLPVFHNVAKSLDSNPGPTAERIGSYLMILLYQVSLLTSCLFMTANANNPMIAQFSKDIMGINITWADWAIAMLPPCIVVMLVIPWLVIKVCPATLCKIDNAIISAKGLEELGPMSSKEKTLAFLFVLTVIGWATGGVTKIDATSIAIAFLACCLVTGVVQWESLLKNTAAWSTFIWYGGIISFANALAKANFFDWLGKLIGSHIDFTGMNFIVILVAILMVSVVIRYLFVSVVAFVVSMIPVFMTFGMAAQIPPAVLTFSLVFSAMIGSLTTHYGNAVGPIIFGLGYVEQRAWWKVGHVMTYCGLIIFLVVGLTYWKLLGIW